MLVRALKMAFWVSFDHLGKMFIVSALWSAMVLGALAVSAALMLVGSSPIWFVAGLLAMMLSLGGVMPIATTGIAHFTKELLDRRDGSVWTFVEGVRFYWKRAAIMGMVYASAVVCLGTSIGFYAAFLHNSIPWLGYGLSALAFWALLFVFISSLYAAPALVQRKLGAWPTLKLCSALVVDNPLVSGGLAVQILAWSVIALLVPPLFVFLYGGVASALMCCIYEMLARRYAAKQSGHPEDTKKADEEDDYLNRGFRDLLFPWKS